ncbi:TIGR03759 family integrating conjugative element protein [Microbulbifer sp. ZKSA006]|uniref:TIGR03759 family integrating conjugative element protein n=1 Tax=Microbulbifer sp. ZKSA006 TaxID=3243390 RepID=UPI004039E883
MRFFTVIIFLAVSDGAIANNSSSTESAQTKVSQTPIVQTPDAETLAGYWSLDAKEYQRYQALMRGPLGHWSPTIDPLLALGMFATSPTQQKRYAELYARQEFELTERTLRFQQAYRAAFQRLYPNVDTVDQRLLAPYQLHQQQKESAKAARWLAKKQFQDGDRVMVFVPAKCDHCTSLIPRLMSLVSGTRNAGIDVYVRNASDDKAVRAWAQAHHIRTAQVNGNTLTLNRNEGLLQRLQHRTAESRSTKHHSAVVPIFLKRNDQFFQLREEDLGL